ncbi:hypothetical protein SAY86_023413 [Trapa natans]|uniref:Fe2OG dioxygenase domain-containing protein n=1 Tax=Trapa natans TaxID=22666 RepID=A0AAN7RBI0_TRANT|nr:hypothetical protein SAY86_023413 [Trapa natans]
MGTIDPAFIQSLEQRPDLHLPTVAGGVPLIDLSLSGGGRTLEQLASEVGDACRTWGFFQVINHGVPSELRARLEAAAKEFYDLPVEEKRKVKRDEVNPMGYHDSEHTKNVRDWKEVFDFVVKDPTLIPASPDPDEKELRELINQWPQQPRGFRDVCEEYAREVEKLAYRLLELISISLGLPPDRFHGYFNEQQTTFMRLNHYPPCPDPTLALGVGPHKDGGALTVLAQDSVGGLQVRRTSDGKWIPIEPVPGAYIINLGNCMQVWTNDAYISAEHRAVVNTQKERFSIPFFFFPGHHVFVSPLDDLTDDRNPPRYQPFKWGTFFATRNRSDYKKLQVENIQIKHFKKGQVGS